MGIDIGSIVSNLLGKVAKDATSQISQKAQSTVHKATQDVSKGISKGVAKALQKKEDVEFSTLPKTLDELMACEGSDLKDPFKTAAFMIVALNAYAENPEAGLAMFNYLNGPEEFGNREKQALDFSIAEAPYIPRSYFKGAVPGNDYTPTMPYTVHVEENSYSRVQEGYITLYVTSGGADSPRQILMRSKGDKWYIYQTQQQLMMGIRLPKSMDKWAD